MISARFALFVALLVACASAFGVPPAQVAKAAVGAASEVNFAKAAFVAAPASLLATPALAMVELPSQSVALEVQFGAYLAVLLGTFLPVLFLINLYIQTESRKAGRAGGQDSE